MELVTVLKTLPISGKARASANRSIATPRRARARARIHGNGKHGCESNTGSAPSLSDVCNKERGCCLSPVLFSHFTRCTEVFEDYKVVKPCYHLDKTCSLVPGAIVSWPLWCTCMHPQCSLLLMHTMSLSTSFSVWPCMCTQSRKGGVQNCTWQCK